MQIVKAEVKDLDSLLPLYSAYRAFYKRNAEPAAEREFLSANLTENRSTIFIAIDAAGRPVGFTQLYPRLSSLSMTAYLYLSDLYVADSHRQQGVARKLMKQAEEYAITTGATSLQLETAHTNSSAQSLYESLGYTQDHDYRTYYLKIASPELV